MPNNDDDDERNDPMELMQLAAMNINGLSQQMGIMNKAVNAIKDDVSELRAEMVDAKSDIRGLKDDQFVDLIKADNIKQSAQSRVKELLEIEFDERGGVTDESRYDYVRYYGKFVQRLHCDARNAGLEGPRIYATPRKNYQALINFINDWVPLRGVEGLKSYYDGLADAKKRKKRNA
jgi:hypothetical protein